MIPRLAIVDPELCYGLPPEVTASTGLDALTQLLEPFVCRVPNPLVDALCREGLGRAIRALPRALREGRDEGARSDLSLSSLLSGMALANAKLGAVHGLAAPIGGAFPAPHGAVCAALLGAVAAANVAALRARAPDSPALARYAEVAGMLRAGEGAQLQAQPQALARPEDAAPLLAELASSMGIRGLSAYGVAESDLADLARKAASSSSMQGNPISLSQDELEQVLRASL